ncbi:MAG: MATE family efflux transporter [Candidatus Stahlbacteria bacterium]|nr:MAG: MATE family efflux transporter [Candidatus Stahlbacteria bacterium]
MQNTIQKSYFNIFKQLTILSWPIILAFSMQVGYNIIDIFWVGKLGATAIAAVSLAGNVFFIILAVGQILGSGTIALVAQFYGAKQIDNANNIIRQSLLLVSIIALPVCISGFIFAKQIMFLLGGQADVLIISTSYLRIIFIGFFFQLISFTINYAFRGIGDMKTPMKIMLVATIINLILDPLLIFGLGFFPRLEVQGAAIATVIAKCVSFLFGFIILIRGRSGIKLNIFKKWYLKTKVIKTILSVGIPVGISYGLMAFSNMAVFRIVSSFSEYALAALGIGIRILQLASLPVVSIGIATTTLAGQSLGARDIKKTMQIGNISMLFSTAITISFGIIFVTNAKFLVSIFTQNPQVINYGLQFMQIVSLYLVFIGITMSLTGVFRGAGDTLPPMFAGLFKLALLIALAILFSQNLGMGITGVWWAIFISYSIETIIITIWYASGKWHKKGLGLLDNINTVHK